MYFDYKTTIKKDSLFGQYQELNINFPRHKNFRLKLKILFTTLIIMVIHRKKKKKRKRHQIQSRYIKSVIVTGIINNPKVSKNIPLSFKPVPCVYRKSQFIL